MVNFKGKIFVCGKIKADNFQGNMSLQVYDAATSEWTSCINVPQGPVNFKISCLRMQREVLDTCEVLS